MLSKFLSLEPNQANIESLATGLLVNLTSADPTTNRAVNPCVAYAKVVAIKRACELALEDLGARANEFCTENQLGEDGSEFEQENLIFRRMFKLDYDYSRYDTDRKCAKIESKIQMLMEEKKLLTKQLDLEHKLILNEHPKMQPTQTVVTFCFRKAKMA